MMRSLSLADIAKALGVEVPTATCSARDICTDTRALQAGDLFVALRGEHFDGHGFLETAREKSFTRAAEKLFLTQPAVSLQVKALEEE